MLGNRQLLGLAFFFTDFAVQALLLLQKSLHRRVIFLKQASLFLVLLLQREQLRLEFDLTFKSSLCFGTEIDSPHLIAIVCQQTFRGIQLSLDRRKLFFQKIQGLFGFGTAHLDILAHIGLRNGIKHIGDAIRIATGIRNFQDIRILFLFVSVNRRLQTFSNTQDRGPEQTERLPRFSRKSPDTNRDRIRTHRYTVRLSDFTHDKTLPHRREKFVCILRPDHGNPLFVFFINPEHARFRRFKKIQVHTAFTAHEPIHNPLRLCHIVQMQLLHHRHQNAQALYQVNLGNRRTLSIEQVTKIRNSLAALGLRIELEHRLVIEGIANIARSNCTCQKSNN